MLKKILKTQQGQSTVEYILLIAVLVSFATAVFKNKRFREFLGPESEFFTYMRYSMEYNYRHARPMPEGVMESRDLVDYKGATHSSYFGGEGADGSRFFYPLEANP